MRATDEKLFIFTVFWRWFSRCSIWLREPRPGGGGEGGGPAGAGETWTAALSDSDWRSGDWTLLSQINILQHHPPATTTHLSPLSLFSHSQLTCLTIAQSDQVWPANLKSLALKLPIMDQATSTHPTLLVLRL